MPSSPTAAYWVAGSFAILLGFLPKVGAVVKIWIDNHVDFSRPTNKFTAATALVVGIADFTFSAGELSFNGIALGTLAAIVVYHARSAVERVRS